MTMAGKGSKEQWWSDRGIMMRESETGEQVGGEAQVMGMRWLQGKWKWQKLEWRVWGQLVDGWRMGTKGPGEVRMRLEEGTEMQTVTHNFILTLLHYSCAPTERESSSSLCVPSPREYTGEDLDFLPHSDCTICPPSFSLMNLLVHYDLPVEEFRWMVALIVCLLCW